MCPLKRKIPGALTIEDINDLIARAAKGETFPIYSFYGAGNNHPFGSLYEGTLDGNSKVSRNEKNELRLYYTVLFIEGNKVHPKNGIPIITHRPLDDLNSAPIFTKFWMAYAYAMRFPNNDLIKRLTKNRQSG